MASIFQAAFYTVCFRRSTKEEVLPPPLRLFHLDRSNVVSFNVYDQKNGGILRFRKRFQKKKKIKKNDESIGEKISRRIYIGVALRVDRAYRLLINRTLSGSQIEMFIFPSSRDVSQPVQFHRIIKYRDTYFSYKKMRTRGGAWKIRGYARLVIRRNSVACGPG